MGYSNKTFACPFFTWDERLAVHCEGGRVTFPDKEAALEYIDRYCASPAGWRECSMAAALLLLIGAVAPCLMDIFRG